MSKTVIYKITSPSGKVYIGQTRRMGKRITAYKGFDCKDQTKLYNSLKFYGWKEHKFEIIHNLPTDVTQEVLDDYEVLYWQLYKDCGMEMMNLKKPGKGQVMTDEIKRKISLSNKGKNLGKKSSEETKKKISLGLLGKTTGRKHSEEAKQKMRDAHKNPNYDHTHNIGRKASLEHKLKLSLAKKGKPTNRVKPVIQMDLKHNFIKEWPSIGAARIGLNTKTNIGDCCNGKRKTCKKFKWKFKDL